MHRACMCECVCFFSPLAPANRFLTRALYCRRTGDSSCRKIKGKIKSAARATALFTCFFLFFFCVALRTASYDAGYHRTNQRHLDVLSFTSDTSLRCVHLLPGPSRYSAGIRKHFFALFESSTNRSYQSNGKRIMAGSEAEDADASGVMLGRRREKKRSARGPQAVC